MASVTQIQYRLKAFVSWFIARGGYIHPATELAYDFDRGVHLRVKIDAKPSNLSTNPNSAFPPGTLVISCPHSASLSALNVLGFPPLFPYHLTDLDAEDNNFFGRLRNGSRPQFVAAIWLCTQWLEGETSAWKQYLDVLPIIPRQEGQNGRAEEVDRGVGEIDTPMWWSEQELKWMRGTNLDRGRLDLEAAWRGEWGRWEDEVKRWATKRHWNLDWTLFKWAMAIHGSRAFSSTQITSVPNILSMYNPDMLLYPGIDCLNHNPLSQNRWISDRENFAIICEDEPGLGEEIWNPYGGKSNGELLLSYGFALHSNPCDTFALKLPQSLRQPYPLIRKATVHSDQLASSPSPATITDTAYSMSSGPLPMTQHNRPPALSLEHNVYYIRPSSRFCVDEPDYPSSCPTSPSLLPPSILESVDNNQVYNQVNGLSHLTGMPHLLLSTLSHALASPIELDLLHQHPECYDPLTLWQQLGPRNTCAVSALLMARLKMEWARIDTLMVAPTTAYLRGGRLRTWRLLVEVYLHDQRSILNDNIKPLDSYFIDLILGTPKPPANNNNNNNNDPRQLDLQHALRLLEQVNTQTYTAFTAGITSVLGTADVSALRDADCEDDIWTLWVGIMAHAVHGARDSSVEAGAPDWLVQWMARLTAQYALHNDHATTTTTTTRAHDIEEDEEDDAEDDVETQITTHISTLLAALSTSHNTNSNTIKADHSLWEATNWRREFIRGCVRVVRAEGVSVRVDAAMRLRMELGCGEGLEEAGAGGEIDILILFTGA